MAETKVYPGLVALNGNLLAAVDFETTGRRPGYHEIVQIAVVPLDSEIRPLAGVRPFYTNIKPQHPDRIEKSAFQVNGLDLENLMLYAPESERVADLLVEYIDRLRLPFGKVLVPLVQNWAFESSFFKAWIGPDMVDKLFHSHARDPMLLAVAMNDRAAFMGEELPFNRVGLGSLCNKLGVTNANAHDALADCLATADVYRALLTFGL
jgi:DNA polymerase III epsilon subunit-like protein